MADVRFRAWAQSRIGTALRPDSGEPEPARFAPGITLTETMSGHSREVVPDDELTMLGPGGVAGLDPRVVVRIDPAHGARDAESNYLASIELGVPELPWLLTPARAGVNDRLRPWIVLVVAEVATTELDGSGPLPVLRVGRDELPDLTESWAWAHVQEPAPGAVLPPGLGVPVGQTVSRLLCPRRLAENRSYRACVVPAFAGGVAAGLGGSAPDTESHQRAWEIGPGPPVSLPVYYHWEFATGEEGDFEHLVNRLEPADLSALPGFGALFVDLRRPWGHRDRPLLDRDETQTVAVQSALCPVAAPPGGTASDEAMADFQQRLRVQLEAPADRLAGAHDPDDRTGAVAPPLYGGRHVNQGRVPEISADVDWVRRLNLHPHNRIAAGLGAEYIRGNQEELMARAWEQVGAVREANRQRAIAELATEVATSVHRRHVRSMTHGQLLALAAPAATRTRTPGGATLAMQVAVSPLPDGAVSSAFARLLRPAGPVARVTSVTIDAIVERGLAGQLPDPVPLLARIEPAELPADPDTDIEKAVGAALRATGAGAVAQQVVVLDALAAVAEAHQLAGEVSAVRAGIDAIADLDMDAVRSADDAARARLRALFATRLDDPDLRPLLDAFGLPAQQSAAVDELGVRIDAGELRSDVVAALEPGDRIARRLATRVKVTEPPGRSSRSALEPVMEYPTFPVPAALTLLATAPEWFLHGIDAFPGDRAALLRTNDEFIASYLVGLNHEMQRELRWREYPTDLRGTPFARFWPRPDGKVDIAPIHTWDAGPAAGPRRTLGDHVTLADAVSVLLVRGEVVRRFPNLVVAAARAQSPSAPDPDPANWRRPIFVVPVDPATAAYAFAVSEAELRAAPGWFFVLQEHSYRIRFGFDLPGGTGFNSWNDLAWRAEPPRGFGEVPMSRGFADADADLVPPPPGPLAQSDARWGTDAADIARIALQMPVRVAIHASRLIGT